jgi:hypothetical protein
MSWLHCEHTLSNKLYELFKCFKDSGSAPLPSLSLSSHLSALAANQGCFPLDDVSLMSY